DRLHGLVSILKSPQNRLAQGVKAIFFIGEQFNKKFYLYYMYIRIFLYILLKRKLLTYIKKGA
ncbi:hypothetical protein, partial [Fructilactobacillus sanfranciscensis]|uniref:hypothetical protein n=1 Tax=Fructilactobacillus sanfranciscensis TaxID=1625 RepID=UPI001CDAF8FD